MDTVRSFLRGCPRNARTSDRTEKEKYMKKYSASYLAQAGVIAAAYVGLTLVFAPISFGAVQVRIAELMTILPLFTSAAIPGLFIGCILANLLGGGVVLDVIFGSIATLIGAAIGYALRRNRWLVPIPAILANMIIVPLVLRFGYGITIPYLLLVLYVAAGEIMGCYVLGELFATILLKHGDRILQKIKTGSGR